MASERSGLNFGYRSASIDCRNSRGASGKRPRIAWLLMTMNSVSPVAPLAARRMCSSSERFIPAQNLHPLVLGHQDGERAALPHARGIFTPVFQHLDDAFDATPCNDIEPLP